MQCRYTVVTEPAVEPVTVAEVKAQLRVNGTDEDTLIEGLITTARIEAEGYLKRALITQTLDLSLDGWPYAYWTVPFGRLQSVTSITYYDTDDNSATVDTDIYQVDVSGEQGRIGLRYAQIWPTVVLRSLDAVRIRIVCGYGDEATDVPRTTRQAIILHASWAFENRIAEGGGGSASSQGRVPRQWRDLLDVTRLYA